LAIVFTEYRQINKCTTNKCYWNMVGLCIKDRCKVRIENGVVVKCYDMEDHEERKITENARKLLRGVAAVRRGEITKDQLCEHIEDYEMISERKKNENWLTTCEALGVNK
jgi:hypothetical protein